MAAREHAGIEARVVQEHTVIEMSERNQRTFAEALMNPPEPNAALRKAAKAYSRQSKRCDRRRRGR